MDQVQLARSLFGSSMAFHIIFATLGVGLPVMIIAAEVLFQVRKDADYATMAMRWTKAFAILLGVAIPSGTIVGVMLALLWPGFMEIVGQVIALPFQIEIWAFFLEALFMSIYVYAADRLKPWMRIVSVVFVSIGATGSAVLITDAHAWMNTPRGFSIDADGVISNVDPWAAVFNPSFFVTAGHVALSGFMTGAFAVASVAAWKLMRRGVTPREASYHRKGLMIALVIGAAASLGTALNGHSTAQMLHVHEPEKLAAAEGLFETTAYAPLAIGGIVDEETQSVKYGFHIPWALSFLAGNSFKTVVRGLNEFPRENWPPLFVHTLFNLMVVLGSLLIVMSFGALVYWWRSRKPMPRWMLGALVLSGPMALVGIETGWVFSCSARQPWTIYHIQRTADAATSAGNLGKLFVLFLGLYALLMAVTILVLWFYFKRNPVSRELSGMGRGA
ncbi:cytochrome ubiquinol oxidase subunit I [Paenibacillus albicereus]|uniref:Cytochrome ubiquinol oxidase subunit I n=1 Tax=Paenibacillus albicereus TaxID=2726185 RepID=A0A6H2GTP1_9BACL|nr:cytochrome ubiquinol oxidase subunit I [Paenibacillus albicereus]QJC50729.1 cytochrome ubiquinol oxidase subunit I [Paenibacillus albicereus]